MSLLLLPSTHYFGSHHYYYYMVISDDLLNCAGDVRPSVCELSLFWFISVITTFLSVITNAINLELRVIPFDWPCNRLVSDFSISNHVTRKLGQSPKSLPSLHRHANLFGSFYIISS